MSRTAFALAAVISVAFVVPSSGQDRGRGAGPGNGAAAPPGRGRQAGPGYPKFFDSNLPFQPRDLAGIWTPNGNGFGGGGRCRDCGDRGFSMEFPVFTPAGQAAFDRNIPSYGRAKDSDDAKAHPEEHIGRRRAQPPALGNDTPAVRRQRIHELFIEWTAPLPFIQHSEVPVDTQHPGGQTQFLVAG